MVTTSTPKRPRGCMHEHNKPAPTIFQPQPYSNPLFRHICLRQLEDISSFFLVHFSNHWEGACRLPDLIFFFRPELDLLIFYFLESFNVYGALFLVLCPSLLCCVVFSLEERSGLLGVDILYLPGSCGTCCYWGKLNGSIAVQKQVQLLVNPFLYSINVFYYLKPFFGVFLEDVLQDIMMFGYV